MKTLIVGDHFIMPEQFRGAIERMLGGEFGPLEEVVWGGASRAEQQAAMQVMENSGPEDVPAPQEIIEAVADAEVIAIHFAPVPETVLEAGERLRAVVVARAGVENVNVEVASADGIAVVNVLGRNAPAVAEQTLALMIECARHISRADAAIKAGEWRTDFSAPMRQVGGSTVGLVGFGHVGRQLARRLLGFRVRLLVYDPYVERDTIDALGGEKVVDLEQLFRESDFISLHARLSEETRGFIGLDLFELMKPTAYFINNARSRLVRYDELYEVLAAGRIAGGAIDVHDDEPLPDDSPWRSLENVTLTPHVAGQTEETVENSVQLVAEAIGQIAGGSTPPNTVNAEALAARHGAS